VTVHRVGDLVKVSYDHPLVNGKECVVISGLMEFSHHGTPYLGHRVSIPHPVLTWCAFEPDELIPISRLTVDELTDAKEVA